MSTDLSNFFYFFILKYIYWLKLQRQNIEIMQSAIKKIRKNSCLSQPQNRTRYFIQSVNKRNINNGSNRFEDQIA